MSERLLLLQKIIDEIACQQEIPDDGALNAIRKDILYLLRLERESLLNQVATLAVETAKVYGAGWLENPGEVTEITPHIVAHNAGYFISQAILRIKDAPLHQEVSRRRLDVEN